MSATIARLQAHLDEYRDGRTSGEELVIDCLATLRHFADAHAVDFANADRIAENHHHAEKASS